MAWDSQAQPFISQSTAEAEVISYNLAYQIGEGVSSLLQVGFATSKQLYGDSKSGIAVIASECGPWRTRHLRLRSSKLRELVQDPQQPWSIRHLPGQLLVADGLTKVLQYQSFEKFRGQLRMQAMTSPEMEMNPVVKKCRAAMGHGDFWMKFLSAVGGLLCLNNYVRCGVGLVALAAMLQQRGVCEREESKAHEKPKVRAFRVLAKDEGAGGEDQPTAPSRRRGQGAVLERGQDAMRMHDLAQGLGSLHISPSVTVNVSVGGGTTALQSPSTLRSSSTLQSPSTFQSSSSMPSSSQSVGPRLATSPAARAVQPKASVAGNRSAAGYLGAERQQKDEEIWNEARFQIQPRGHDQWLTDCLGAGWLIRTHGKGRVRPFHPLHRSCPLLAHELIGDRVTILFDAGGNREVLADRWTIQRTWQRPGQWRGYTLLRATTSSERPTANPASSEAAATAEVESDDSYSVVTDLDGQRPWVSVFGTRPKRGSVGYTNQEVYQVISDFDMSGWTLIPAGVRRPLLWSK